MNLLRFLLCGLLLCCQSSPARGADLTVFAATSLTDAFRELGPMFERSHAGTRLRFSFAASSLLRTQIEQGAPADVFASADQEQIQPLVRSGKLRAVTPFVRNRLVVVTPAANPGRVSRLSDLARSGVRLVVTAPQVPIGRYTRRTLTKLSVPGALGRSFQDRVLRNVVSQEANARSLLTKVLLGEADAALVYASDAAAAGRKVRTLPISTRYNEVAIYPAGVVAGSASPGQAAAFVRFLRSAPARAALKRHGFQPY